jgi:hypothetical protein
MNAAVVSDARSYQLYLLFQMNRSPKVEAALARLGADQVAMVEAVERVGNQMGLNEPGHGIELYRQLLGPPLDTALEPDVDAAGSFVGSLRHRYHLPLWPEFDFIIRSHPEGWAWGPRFIRAAGSTAPTPARIVDLEPWSMLESEVLARFGPFYEEYAFNHSSEAIYLLDPSTGLRASLAFDFQLFQSVVADVQGGVGR